MRCRSLCAVLVLDNVASSPCAPVACPSRGGLGWLMSKDL